jgi:uroporphyrin-III C-methyltransferase
MTYPRIIGGASLLVALSLHQKTTLIIGASHLAVVRAAAALQADSRVIIVVRKQNIGEYEEEIKVRWERGEIEVVEFDKDVEGDTLEPLLDTLGIISVAFVTDTLIGSPRRRGFDSAVGMCKALKKRNILVNVADQPSLCDFTLPACHRFNYTLSGSTSPSAMAPSSLQIAVTTNGKGCRLAGRIRREIITRLPENIGDAVENLSALRQAAKDRSNLSEENEDSLPLTPNDPVPQRRLDFKSNIGDSTVEETAEEATKRRMRWVAQISEFWPLERLAALDAQQREDALRDAIHKPQVISQFHSEQVSTIPPTLGVQPAVSQHKLDLNRSSPLPPKGRIYLLGSGPGHPGLLTVAAHDILTKKATLILSDKLVPAEVLALIPSNITVKIAKKFPGNADGAQSEMMLEAVEAAGRGETVVRVRRFQSITSKNDTNINIS